jgi:hypothetical protein
MTLRRQSRRHAGGSHNGSRRFCFCPTGGVSVGIGAKESVMYVFTRKTKTTRMPTRKGAVRR